MCSYAALLIGKVVQALYTLSPIVANSFDFSIIAFSDYFIHRSIHYSRRNISDSVRAIGPHPGSPGSLRSGYTVLNNEALAQKDRISVFFRCIAVEQVQRKQVYLVCLERACYDPPAAENCRLVCETMD
ncbi:hypothetical protein MN608_08615 [Microdochium nivale]|nr:hypothetical protein MN608_08615 [Microdochium nivale]